MNERVGERDADAKTQEVSEILAGRISNQDEEEVEDELAALEAEVANKNKNASAVGVQQQLPSVPDTQLPAQQLGAEPAAERTKTQTERQAMLAA